VDLNAQGVLFITASSGIEDAISSSSANPFMDKLVSVLLPEGGNPQWSNTVATKMTEPIDVLLEGNQWYVFTPVALTLGANFIVTRSGPVLASVPVDPTEYHQSPATGDPFPPPPPAGTNWQQDAPVVFPIAPPKAALLITNTLQSQAVHEQFLFTPCRPDDEGCILSKWVMITSPAAAIQAQFAVMLTYAPASSDREKQTKVQLYYIVRQGYLGGSEWSYTVNNSITDLSAHALLDVKRALTMYLK
jgi:hypothetical protein